MTKPGVANLPRPRPLPANLKWRENAACKDYPYPDDFFSDNELIIQFVKKKFCKSCPVRKECLQEALESKREWGVWGGLSPKQIAWLRNKRAGRRVR